jgi:hypothetical protein
MTAVVGKNLVSAENTGILRYFPGILIGMIRWLTPVLFLAVAGLKSRRYLRLEILALRHQLLVLSRKSNRPRLTPLVRCVEA